MSDPFSSLGFQPDNQTSIPSGATPSTHEDAFSSLGFQPDQQSNTSTGGQPGFFSSLAQGIVKPFEEIGASGLNKINKATDFGMPIPTENSGVMGNGIAPITTGKQFAGDVLEGASNFLPAGEIGSLAKNGLPALKPFLKNTAIAGAKTLGAFGAGQALTENKSIPDVLKSGAESALAGAAFGPALATLPFAPSLIKNGVQKVAGNTADQMINSLIKPLMKNFAYSKDPARGVLQEGLTGNSIEELHTAVTNRLQDVGTQIGATGDQLTSIGRSTGKSLDLTPALAPLEVAMDNAAKTGNETLLRSFQNVKTALTNELGRVGDEHGNQTIVSNGTKNLTDANYSDAVKFLNDVKDHTKFTGHASDDKALNSTTQQIYGIARDAMNKYASEINPEAGAYLKNLNQRYGDLSSADLAIQNRELAMKKNNMFNFAETLGQMGGGTIALTHLLTGDVAGFAHWAGATALEMAVSKTARSVSVQTTLAKFLNNLSGTERRAILEKSPDLQKWYEKSHELKALPAPKEGSPQSSNYVPINLAPKSVSTQDAEMVSKFGKEYPKTNVQGPQQLELPAPKEGMPQSSNNVPISVSPTDQKDISRGFSGTRNLRGFMDPKTALGGALTSAGALATARNFGNLSNSQSTPEIAVPESKGTSFTVKDRGVNIDTQDMKSAAPVIFGEISNRSPEKQEMEARIILNTAINRMKAYEEKGTPKTLSEVLSMPNQYQAYGGKQYKEFTSQSSDTSTTSKKQEVNKIVSKLLDEIKNGTFKDNTNGAYFYQHKDGKIYYDDAKKLFK